LTAKREDVERVVKLLGSGGVWRGGKLLMNCPFAGKTHSGGTDRNPSFAIFEGSTGRYGYRCMTCNEAGSLDRLYWRLHQLGLPRIPHLSLACHGETDEHKPKPPLRVLEYAPGGRMASGPIVSDTSYQADFQLDVPVVKRERLYHPPDEKLLQRWLDAPVPDYAVRRGFGEIHREWGLGFNEQKHRWVHVVRDEHGATIGYTARLVWNLEHCFRCGEIVMVGNKYAHACECGEKYVKYVHHPGDWRRRALFGIDRHVEGESVVLVEGTTDAMNLWRHGVRHPVAVLGSGISPEQVQSIARRTKQVFAVGDGDVAGRKMNADATRLLNAYGVAVDVIELPDGEDPGSLSGDQVRIMFDKRLKLV
jgi:hypothetical protein